jgi:hypothetical protein
MKSKTGGAAFPNEAYGNAGPHTGMTLRDYFAAKAMQVLMAETNGEGDDIPGAPRWESHNVAELAYEHADAMLEERDK